jgi:hypothetical protein
LPDKDEVDAFLHHGRSVCTDQDSVLKISDPPALGGEGNG